MSILNNNSLVGASGQNTAYNLDRSLRFRSSASSYLNRTPASAGNRKTWTWSAWVKRGQLGNGSTDLSMFSAGGTTEYFDIRFNGNDQLFFFIDNSLSYSLYTSSVFRDTSSWYHIVVSFDTTQATASNRAKLYVNGVLQPLAASSYPAQNYDGVVNSTVVHSVGRRQSTTNQYFDGYMTEVNFIDGQALTPSSFGQTSSTTGVWQPKKYAGTYGTNGFYLPFTDNSALTSGSNAGLGKDFSGNGNYWNTNNISITSGATYDSMTDVPTLTSATASNFCVMNPLSVVSPTTISGGNLNVETGSTGGGGAFGTMAIPSSGKYYFEYTMTSASATIADNGRVGLLQSSGVDILYLSNGNKRIDGTGSSYGATWQTNDTIGMAIDVDGSSVTFYKNGTSQGAISYTVSSKTMFPYTEDGSGSITISSAFNFGQRPFAYTPPTGFVALNTFNLPTPTIGATASTQANKYFDATLYTGNGSTNTIINAGGFQPDLVWAKDRGISSAHRLVDAVRGVTKSLYSNLTDAETTESGLTAFNSNGFTVGSANSMNYNTEPFVAWQWRASNAAGVTNTAGSITSTVSANTSSGFSVVTYTGNGTGGATVGHGLGVAPKMLIVKNRVQGTYGNWNVWHTALSGSQYLTMNDTSGAGTNNNRWNGTTPTSTVFSLGADSFGNTNKNGDTYVAYVFSEVAGYSKFGSYTGNGSADGTMVVTGFTPRFIMIKRTDTTSNWVIWDTARDTYNASGLGLYANLSAAEDDYRSSNPHDVLSNGFKLRANYANVNASGGTYIYMAFASVPQKFSLGR